MPKKDKASHGEKIRERAKLLLDAILDFNDYRLDRSESLNINCCWKEQDGENPKLVIRTTLRALKELSDRHNPENSLTKEQIREALNQMKNFLKILEDNREHERGSEKWHFTLKLWSTDKGKNINKFVQEWEYKRNSRSKSKRQLVNNNLPIIDNSAQSLRIDNSNNIWSNERIDILKEALRLFTDNGQIEKALVIANLLLERHELNLPLRKEIENFILNHKSPLRQEIESYIDQKQAFKLSYQDTTGNLQTFNVHFAKVVSYEERQYLDCWCEEKHEQYDLEILRHNRTFRLERISEIQKSSKNEQWLSDLDSIKVEMHLLGSLINGYKSNKNEDISNRIVEINGKSVKRIIRKVYNTFWFFREVIRYGADCVIVTPESVRDRFKEKLISLCRLYNLTKD